MTIKELIKKLTEIKKIHGDLNVCISQSHEYWGSVQSHLKDYHISVHNAQPDGPKSGKSELALIIDPI